MEKPKENIRYVVIASVVAALGGVLFGYDTGVISGAIGPLEQRFQLDSFWVGFTASCALLGCILGAGFAGVISDNIGRKKVLIISGVFFLVSALGTALPRTLTEFIIFRFIGGIGVGAASLISPLYIAEISPARLRGRMVSLNQFAIVSGFIIVYFANYIIALGREESWLVQTGWRWMFGSESIPAILLLVFAFFVPESPRWLVKKKKDDKALSILTRISGVDVATHEIKEIKTNLEQEKGSKSLFFKPGIKIVLLIGVVLAVLQQITGINSVMYYAPEIFKNVGVKTENALLQTIVVGLVNAGFTIIAIWTVDKVGRKFLMITGSIGMGVSLVLLGITFYYNLTGPWVLILVLTYIASFSSSIGPVMWVVLSEIFPTQIRGKAMAIATVVLWIACYAVSQTFPIMDKNPWLVENFNHAFSFWVYGVFCFVTIWFVYRFIPETKGKSLEEIERSWTK